MKRADAGGERPLAVAVAAVDTASVQLVGLSVHHGVLDLLGKPAEQVPHVDDVVIEPGHGEHVRLNRCSTRQSERDKIYREVKTVLRKDNGCGARHGTRIDAFS